jgi:hypothetical protein
VQSGALWGILQTWSIISGMILSTRIAPHSHKPVMGAVVEHCCPLMSTAEEHNLKSTDEHRVFNSACHFFDSVVC